MKVTVYNLRRESVGELELSDEVWATEVKEHLLHEVVTAQRAMRRAGTQATLDRSGVAGTGKKLFKQKGTGQARQGSKRAPHRVGGGHAHALEPRSYGTRPPRNVRIGALKSALSYFAKEERLIVVDDFALSEKKTKTLAQTLDTLLSQTPGALQVTGKTLVVDRADNENLVMSIRNLKDHQFLSPMGVNVFDLLRHKHLIVTKDAARALEARCLK
ncbi:MAG: 50S ribosomal protein L4 [Myxococcales bacterium]|nr:50S ribosomal protein L4 [Myxococcales bacterium]